MEFNNIKKIFIIILCMFILSACGNNQTITTDKVSNNVKKEYPEEKDKKEKNIKEKNIITSDILFKVKKKYRDSISLKAVEDGNYYFSYNTDSEWCYAKYCDGKMSNIYSLDNKYDIFYNKIINKNIILGCFLNNKVKIIKINMQGKEETIAEINMSTFPVIEDAGNSLVWCEAEKLENNIEKETVMVYNIDTGKTEATGIACEYKEKNNNYLAANDEHFWIFNIKKQTF